MLFRLPLITSVSVNSRRRSLPQLVALALIAYCLAGPGSIASAECLDYGSYFGQYGASSANNVADLAVAPGRLFGAGARDIYIWNIINGIPMLSGGYHFNTGSDITAIAYREPYLFVTRGASGLAILNVLATPQVVGSYDTPGSASDVFVMGDYAYIADGSLGLQVVNVANPVSPVLAGTLNTPGNAYAVQVENALAYVADGTTGLLVIDIAVPTVPVLRGTVNTPNTANDLTLAGGVAVVLDFASGAGSLVHFIDVTVPTAPAIIGTVASPDGATGISTRGATAFVSSNTRITLIDFSDPAQPVLLGSYVANGQPREMVIADDLLYVASYSSVEVFDTSIQAFPPAPYTLGLATSVRDVAVSDQFAYACAGGLVIVDLTDLADLTIRGQLAFDYEPICVEVDGQYAYLLAFRWGDFLNDWRVVVVDVADPDNPVQVGAYDWSAQSSSCSEIAYADGHLYVPLTYAYEFKIIDVNDPSQPHPVGSLSLTSLGITARDGRLYAHGQAIYDLAVPSSPVYCGSLNGYGLNGDLCFNDGDMFNADAGADLWAISNAMPCQPQSIAFIGLQNRYVNDVAFLDDHVYILKGLGMEVVDAADPSAMSYVGGDFTGNVSGFRIVPYGHALIVGGSNGLSVVPAQCGASTGVGEGEGSTWAGSLFVQPNPMTSNSTISFVASRPGAVDIAVYDVAGRRLRTLHSDTAGHDSVAMTWNGTDDRGVRLPSGVYFVRATTESGVRSARVVLLR